MALQTRRNDPAAYADAIRSIALEELDGESTDRRVQWFAARSGVPASTLRVEIDEMIDILSH